MKEAVLKGGASAIAGSSFFVYQQNNTRSVLINYPQQSILRKELYELI